MDRHAKKDHPGIKMKAEDFRMEITGRFSREIARQCQEGIAISKALDAIGQGLDVELLNSKSEFLQSGVVTRRFSGQLL